MVNAASAPRIAFERLRVPKASEVLAQRVRAAVALGELREGDALPSEKELMAQLGISRSTVREGLRLLEAEGLIHTRAGRGGGAVVCRPSPNTHTRSLALLLQFDHATLGELLEARRAIEPLCGRLAAGRIQAAQLAELHDLVAELAGLTERRDAYLAAQVRFHLAIVRAATNAVLKIYATSLAELTARQIERVSFTPTDLQDGAIACAAILEALEQRDADRVERRIARHLGAIEAAIVRLGWTLDTQPAELGGPARLHEGRL